MAEHQHIHQHYHHVVREPGVPLWHVFASFIFLIFMGFLVASIITGYFLWFAGLVFYFIGLPLLIGGGVVYGIRRLLNLAEERVKLRTRLVQDAKRQHNQVMSGDDAGIYGNYPPAC